MRTSNETWPEIKKNAELRQTSDMNNHAEEGQCCETVGQNL